MKLLINPNDKATLARIYSDAELICDTWKAVPSGKYVDLEWLEREQWELLRRPMPTPVFSYLPFAFPSPSLHWLAERSA